MNLEVIISLRLAPRKTRRRRTTTNKWPSHWMVAEYYEIKTGVTTVGAAIEEERAFSEKTTR